MNLKQLENVLKIKTNKKNVHICVHEYLSAPKNPKQTIFAPKK